MVLCSDTKHVDDLLDDYHFHLKKKEERKLLASMQLEDN